jgi:hypothetical protein
MVLLGQGSVSGFDNFRISIFGDPEDGVIISFPVALLVRWAWLGATALGTGTIA